MLNIDGLASGIDTTSVINGLLSIQQQRIDILTARRQRVEAEQSLFKQVEARLITFRSQASRLARSTNSVFESKQATSSDETLLKVAASQDAAPGIYNLTVTQLARANQVASGGYAAAESEIGQGTVSIQLGSGASVDVVVDATNNTLQGFADAINASDAEVTASVINDGSGGGTPYRLVLTGSESGADNVISVTNNPPGGSPGLPVFDTGNPVQAAQDAEVKIGSGAGALTVNNATNRIEGLIDGVSLDLVRADATKELTVTVENDTEAASSAVSDFVDSFNDLMGFIDDVSRFDAQSETAGLLLGNRPVTIIQDQIRRAVTDAVPGVNGGMNRLSALGIGINDNGHMTLNSAELEDALAGRIEGVTIDDVRRLFALDGQSTNNNIRFLVGSTRTEASTTPYEVDISQAAERAQIVAPNTLAATTVIDGTNNTFQLNVDGADSSVLTLTQGSYTRQELADHLESLINADSELAGREVVLSLQSDSLVITSASYGLASEVTLVSGTATTDLGFAGSESDLGQDVVGKFIVDGVDESAVGRGRLLSADPDNDNTADIQLQVTLVGAQVQAGVDGELTVTRGVTSRLDKLLNSILDPVTGRVQVVNDGFDEQIENIQDTIDRNNRIFDERREKLVAQFVALETAIAELQSRGNFLASQLGSISSL